MDISRKEALRRLTVLLGTTASAPTLSAVLSGCEAAPPATGWTPSVLTTHQLDLLTVVVDRIIPPTDTPGAGDVGVPAFIDLMLDRWVEPETRARFVAGLDGLDAAMRQAHGVAFIESDADRQTALLVQLDRAAARARDERLDPPPFFATLKEWTLAGYYTSEAGATKELQWLAVPGRYDGDAPLGEVGRAWA